MQTHLILAAQGIQGIQGIQGVQGTQGILGQDGFQGVQGGLAQVSRVSKVQVDLYLVQVELGQSPMEHLRASSPQEEKLVLVLLGPSVDLSVEGDVQISGIASVADLKFSSNIVESTSGALYMKILLLVNTFSLIKTSFTLLLQLTSTSNMVLTYLVTEPHQTSEVNLTLVQMVQGSE